MATPPQRFSELKRELTDVPVIHTFYELYLFWSAVQARFPKAKRYSLGQRCDDILLDALENVLKAAHAPSNGKLSYLDNASAAVDMAKFLFRIAKDARCVSNDEYLTLQLKLNEIGKMMGGWLKSTRERNAAP